MIFTPANSLIQLVPTTGNYGETVPCVYNIEDCLPALRGDDIRFQIVFDGLEEPFADYVLKVVDMNDSVVTLYPPANAPTDVFGEIDLHDHEGFVVGTFEQPALHDLLFSDFMDVGQCFTICLFKVSNIYTYTGPFATYPHSVTIQITVNGGTISSDPFNATSDQDIVNVLQGLADALGDGDTVTYDAETNTTTITSDVNVYGLLIVTGAASNEFFPDVTEGYTKTHCSNCFRVIADECFTSVIKYRGNEDQFGFYYTTENTFYNVARMFLYFDSPQPIDDENYFTKSDGSKKVLSARYEKEYEAHTEYFTEQRHFALKAALKHDVLKIGAELSSVAEFTAEGKYDIGWLNKPGSNFDSAPASFKIRPTPFYQVNSNCV